MPTEKKVLKEQLGRAARKQAQKVSGKNLTVSDDDNTQTGGNGGNGNTPSGELEG